MGDHATKIGVYVYLPAQMHRSLRLLSVHDGRSMSVLIEEAAKEVYGTLLRLAETNAEIEKSIKYRLGKLPRKKSKRRHRGKDPEAG